MKLSQLLIAHRGAMDEAPENTRSAFKAAALYPIHGFEFDVQLTKDEVPIIFHDETIQKINGEFLPVADYPFEALARMDWGAWFGYGFRGEPLFTLEEMFTSYGAFKRLLIEMKSYPEDQRSGRSKRVADFVLQHIHRYIPTECRDLHAILSFDRELLAYSAQKEPNFHYVLNLEDFQVNGFMTEKFPAYLDGLCVSIDSLTREFVDYAHGRGCKVMTYSCNNPNQTGHALDCGADVLMTDSPAWLTGYVGG